MTTAVEKCIEIKAYGVTTADLSSKSAKNGKSGLQFLQVINKYWDSELCLAKIKLEE